MNRLAGSVRRIRIDRIDLLMACAMASVAGSYVLGYRLDWRQADTLSPEAMVAANEAAESSSAADEAAEADEENDTLPPSPREVKPAAIIPAEPSPAWAQVPREAAWDAMVRDLVQSASRRPGRTAIFLKDLSTGKTWTYHENELYASASLIKVPIMACVFYRMREGGLALSDRLTLRRRHRVGGSGSLKWRPDGTKITVRELLQHMISESDNTATAMLIDALGIGYLQQVFPRMGLLYTGIYREGMSLRAGRVAHENYTTAREMAMLLEKIYRGELVDKPSSELMLDILKHKKAVASRLAKGLPVGWEIAHKTGLLRRACHDSAIILSPQGDYVITVLTGQNRDYRSAKDFISRLGRITFRHYKGEDSYIVRGSRKSHLALR